MWDIGDFWCIELIGKKHPPCILSKVLFEEATRERAEEEFPSIVGRKRHRIRERVNLRRNLSILLTSVYHRRVSLLSY